MTTANVTCRSDCKVICAHSNTNPVSTNRRCRNALAADIEDVTYLGAATRFLKIDLADVVAENADLGDGLRLEPTPGHTPGHVSLWIESDGATALVSGDFLHHPVQCAEPAWAETGDDFRFAAAVAAFGMLLRGSPHVGSFDYDKVLYLAMPAVGADPQGTRGEFVSLVRRARDLAGR